MFSWKSWMVSFNRHFELLILGTTIYPNMTIDSSIYPLSTLHIHKLMIFKAAILYTGNSSCSQISVREAPQNHDELVNTGNLKFGVFFTPNKMSVHRHGRKDQKKL